MNCEADQEDQNKIAIKEWVSTMEGRIRKLGGQGVDRFLSNLFRAFEGMFLGAETPKHSAQKVLNTLQAIREISAVSCLVQSSNPGVELPYCFAPCYSSGADKRRQFSNNCVVSQAVRNKLLRACCHQLVTFKRRQTYNSFVCGNTT